MLQAQADQQAEHMRKVVEERRKRRLAQQEEDEGKKWAEPRGKEVGPRGKWVEPHALLQLAQQCDSTGSAGEGRGPAVNVAVVTHFVLIETSSAIVFELPSAPAVKASNDPLEPPQVETEHRQQWVRDGASLASLLQQREIQNDTYSNGMF